MTSSSGMLGGAVLEGADAAGDADPPFDDEKKDDRLRRGVDVVDDGTGGEPSGGRSNGSARGDVGERAEPPFAEAGGEDADGAACADSLRRNSIHRFEKDCAQGV